MTHLNSPSTSTATPDGRNLLRMVPAGTKADGRQLEPRHGRYTVVAAADKWYLYVPEHQEIFMVRDELANMLRNAEIDAPSIASGAPMSPESEAAYAFISMLIEQQVRPPLTERRAQHKGLRDVVIHVSQVCNLNCVYCYAVELNKAKSTMSKSVAEAVLDRTMSLAVDGLSSVKFLGGEPTLAWPIIEYLMAGYETASKERGVPVPAFTMVTNGTHMTAAMIRSAAKHNMHILVSIDGPQEIHDRLRPSLGGNGSYMRATRTLEALARGGVDVSIESVYSRDHYLRGYTPQSLIDHFLGLGIRKFHIPPAIGAWHGEDTYEEMADVTRMYAEASRRSVRSFRTDRPYLLRGIQFVMDGFAIRERRRHVCGAGRTFMGVNFDGEAFPCYLLQSPDVSYGHMTSAWDEERYETIRDQFRKNGKEYHPVCRECWANEICQSCLGTSWHLSPEISKPPAFFCAFQKNIIGAVLAEIANARESSDWPLFSQNWQQHLAPITMTSGT